jgi:Flp pilus assembly protein TadD
VAAGVAVACASLGSASLVGATPRPILEITVEVDEPDYDGFQILLDEEARAAMAEGKYRRAWKLFRRLLRIDPHDVHALREIGRLANALGHFEYAVEVLRRVDDLNGTADDPELHYLLGASLYALGRKGEAERELARAEAQLGPGPHDRMGTLWLARIAVVRGDLAGALARYEPLLQDGDPATDAYVEVLLYKVEAYAIAEDWAAAERLLRELLAARPDHERAGLLLAWVLEGRGKLDEELAMRAAFADNGADDPSMTLEYARALERANQYDAAIDRYREARSLGVAEAEHGIYRLERRLAPEVGAGLTTRSDPSGAISGWRAGATVPVGYRLRLAAGVVGETSRGGLTMTEQTSLAASGWAVVTGRRGSLLAFGATQRLQDDAPALGGSAIVHTSPARDVQLQVRGDLHVPWHESASTLRDQGMMDALAAQLYLKSEVSSRRVLVSFGTQGRRLALAPLVGVPMDHAFQVLGSAGVDVTLSSTPEKVIRGEIFDDQMLVARTLSPATVISYRHYEMWSNDPFPLRVMLVERSSIDEVSGVLRRVFGARGIVGAEVRGGLGYDWARYVQQWRVGGSLLLAATGASRLTADYDVASQSGTGIVGRQHVGSLVLHVDL